METLLFENFSYVDTRGEFLRIYDSGSQILNNLKLNQVNISKNPKQLTLRGMHYQIAGPPEHKLITVLSGEIELVVSNAHLVTEIHQVDNKYFRLSEKLHQTLLVSSGLATGWISLSDHANISYLMTARFQDCKYGGFRFDDTFARISWPSFPEVISEKDLNWPPLK